MTKVDGVRQTLAELGNHALPLQIQDHLKRRYGINMTVAHISNCKSEILRKKKGKRKPGRKAAPTMPAETQLATPPAPVSIKGAADFSLQDLQATKALLGKVGVDRLRRLIDLLAK
jgi:hypothetical protein